MKRGTLRFTRARAFMGLRKAPGPRQTTVWSVYYDPTMIQLIRGRKNEFLGQVYWHSPWRRYAFAPACETVFDEDCMTKVGAFCRNATKLFREGKFRTAPTDR